MPVIDDIRGRAVEVYVSLKPGNEPGPEMEAKVTKAIEGADRPRSPGPKKRIDHPDHAENPVRQGGWPGHRLDLQDWANVGCVSARWPTPRSSTAFLRDGRVQADRGSPRTTLPRGLTPAKVRGERIGRRVGVLPWPGPPAPRLPSPVPPPWPVSPPLARLAYLAHLRLPGLIDSDESVGLPDRSLIRRPGGRADSELCAVSWGFPDRRPRAGPRDRDSCRCTPRRSTH